MSNPLGKPEQALLPEEQPTQAMPKAAPVTKPLPLSALSAKGVAKAPTRPRSLANGSSSVALPARRSSAGAKKRGKKKRRHGGASLLQSVISAAEALNTNRLRSLLTTLGIIIGVGAVIVVVSISQGASAAASARLSGLGPNVLTIIPAAQRGAGGVSQGLGTAQSLTQADADAIASQISNVSGVSPVLNVRAQVIFQNQNTQTAIQGVYASYQQIGNWSMAEGAFFTDGDESQSTTVAVIGQTVYQSLFVPLGIDPIGQQIRIGSQQFSIVGLLATKGASALGNADDIIYIPFSTAHQRLSHQQFVSQIAVQASSADAVNQVQSDIQQLLEQRHTIAPGGTDNFTIRNQNQIIQTVQGVATTLTFLLVGVAAVSLVVGGIGIMNIMLVSVTERTREIGIRMAVGARRRDILSQFLIEAIFLSAAGGLIGIGIGIIGAIQVSHVGSLPSTIISPVSVALAFGVAALVGILFGLYPAWRASRLDPITALRVE